MTVHSNLVGGSSAARVIACPGSVVLCQEAPPQTSSAFAQEGSALHDIMELWLVEDIDTKGLHPRDHIGWNHMGTMITQKLYDDKLAPCVKFFNETLDPDEWLCENLVSWGEFIPGAFGTADIIWRKGKRVGLVDWKFGDGVAVSAVDNIQLMFYLGAAVLHTFPEFFEGATEFEGHIFQPFSDGREPHSHAVYSVNDLKAFAAVLFDAVERSKKNDPELAIGDHCRWCPARTICPLLRDAAAGAVDNPVDGMGKAELLKWLGLADELEAWVDSLRAYAMDYQRRNGDLDGYKIVDALGHRRFIDQAATEAWARGRGVLVRDFQVTKFASPAQLEKVLTGYKIKKTDPTFTALIERPIVGERLVPESAKGVAKTSPAAMFANLGQQLTAINHRGSVATK